MNIKPFTFKEKLFRAFLLTSLLPVLLLSFMVFFQTNKITKQAQNEARQDLLLQTKQNITSHVDLFRHSLSLFTENNAFQSAWYNENVSMFERYLFFRDTLDPTMTYIQATNPYIQKIIFFTNSSYADMRLNILSLEELDRFHLKPSVLAPTNAVWVEIDEQTLGIFGGFPNASGFQTFVLITVEKNDVFPEFSAIDERPLGAVYQEATQIYPFVPVDITKDYQIPIENTDWVLFLSQTSLPNAQKGLLLFTLTIVGLSLIIAYYSTRFFAQNISQEITYLKQRVASALSKKTQKQPILNQQNEFHELSNEINDMLEMVLSFQEENHQTHLESKDREYQAMIHQINAHFLYNTLSAVNWRAVLSGQEEISYAIQLLSKYYRTTLNRGQNEISVRDELANVKTYIELQLFLHPDYFTVAYEIDEELLHLPIIHLLLQPIVENAIEHGFNQTKAKQHLRIAIQRETPAIFSIKIEDNGVGFDVHELTDILVTKTRGYGLNNINQRIKFYFGEQYGLLFDSAPGLGTLVTILLPIQHK